MYTNSYNRGEGRTIMRRYSNCNELGYNVCTYKKDKEMSNVYNSD